MKLAVKKDTGSIPMSGFHYMLMPKKMDRENEHKIWEAMGFIIIDVSEDEGQRLLHEAGQALRHQVEVAYLTEQTLLKAEKLLSGDE